MRFPRIPGFDNLRTSLALLKGNTRICVIFEPMWGVPYVLYNFYLGLYMMERGASSAQIGYLISLGYLAGTLAAMFAGVITDRLGRRLTTLIFDLLAWPLAMILYIFAKGFALFALATVLNNLSRVASVSFNLLVIEDADGSQRASAYNFIGMINIASGILVPLAGVAVRSMGLVPAEHLLLTFAAVSMFSMMVLRHKHLTETQTGLVVMAEKRREPLRQSLAAALPFRSARALARHPAALKAVSASILFNTCLIVGGMNSLYFAPYMTRVLRLDNSAISVLGGLYAWLLLAVFVWINPAVPRHSRMRVMVAGLCLQSASLFLLTVIPANSLAAAVACVFLFSIGFGVFKPLLDTLVAEATEGTDRSGTYSLLNALLSLGTAFMGALAGMLQSINPRLVYWLTALILLVCVLLVQSLRKTPGAGGSSPGNARG